MYSILVLMNYHDNLSISETVLILCMLDNFEHFFVVC